LVRRGEDKMSRVEVRREREEVRRRGREEMGRRRREEKLTLCSQNSIWSNLLRPSFVKGYGKPLCSDAFTGFLNGDPNKAALEEDVKEATKFLHAVVIPKFARHLVHSCFLIFFSLFLL
jgi:hypothetical protein